MIKNWEEITARYDLIKDHKPRATKKLKELGEILASAYRLDPHQADEMWQYIIELNISDDITFSKFYIAQVFNKLTTYLTPEEATQFVTIRPERVHLMLMYGYDGGTLNHIVYTIIGYQVLNEKMDDAIEILSVLKDKFSVQDEPNTYSLCSVLNSLCVSLEEHSKQNEYTFRYDIPLESILTFYDICSREFEDEYIQTILQTRKCLLTGKNIPDTESINRNLHNLTELAAQNSFEFNYLFTDFLFFERDVIGYEAENIIYNYFSESNRIYIPIATYSDDEKLLKRSKWYQEIIVNSQRILRELFRKERCQDFHKKTLQCYMFESDWKTFLQFLVLGLNQETESGASSYLEFIKEEIRDYLFIKGKKIEFEDDKWWVVYEQSNTFLSESKEYSINSNTSFSTYSWRRSITKPRVTKDNINDFIMILARACILTSSSPINEQLIDEVRAFVTKETGNVDALLEIGMEVEADNRTELEKLIDFSKKESNQREPYDNTRTNQISPFIRSVERETETYGVETGKILAKQPSILSFLFLHDAHSFSIKENIILGALLDGNYTSALKCVDYMIETASYPNFSDRNSWAMEMKNTLSCILRSVFQKNKSEYDQPYPENVTSTVVQIVEKCLQYLGGDDANEVKANLIILKPSDEGKDNFIRQLLQDVDDYTAEKKPKGYSKRINNITSGIIRGIEVLSKLDRMDVVAQILRKITDGKKYITGPSYESWMINNLWCISNEQLIELYSLIPDVYAEYIDDSNSIMSLNLLRQFGKTGNLSVYNALKKQIIQRHGYIDGMGSCFKYSVETSSPILLCRNKIFEVAFLYWNITSFNCRTGIYSIEVVFQVKNHNKEYISLLASDISINGIPMSNLKTQEENDTSNRTNISYYLGSGQVETNRLPIYLGNQKMGSFNEISKISFSIVAQNDENDIALEGPFTITYNSNDDTFALNR